MNRHPDAHLDALVVAFCALLVAIVAVLMWGSPAGTEGRVTPATAPAPPVVVRLP